MARLNRFVSFLDRFEEQLQVESERLKSELNRIIDHHCGLLKHQVHELRGRVSRVQTCRGQSNELPDGPNIEIVALEDYRAERDALAIDAFTSKPSSSKRKQPQSTPNGSKKQKTNANAAVGLKMFVCKFAGCSKAFDYDSALKLHERIHLGVKPFRCTWPNCGFRFIENSAAVKHVRAKHFKIPRVVKEMQRLNITEDRDPNDYIEVDNDQLARRLE